MKPVLCTVHLAKICDIVRNETNKPDNPSTRKLIIIIIIMNVECFVLICAMWLMPLCVHACLVFAYMYGISSMNPCFMYYTLYIYNLYIFILYRIHCLCYFCILYYVLRLIGICLVYLSNEFNVLNVEMLKC